MERCPVCSEPLNSGIHCIGRHPSGEPFLLCPSFEEFVLDVPVVMVQIDAGLVGQAQSAAGED